MPKLTRKEFLLMCGAGILGLIGGTSINRPKQTEEKNNYITNITVNPDEFLYLKRSDADIFYIAVGGAGLMQGEEDDFTNSLIKQGIIPYDACEIHSLPKVGETSDEFPNLLISNVDGLNYTLASEDEALITSVQKHSSDILAKNYELFGDVYTKTR